MRFFLSFLMLLAFLATTQPALAASAGDAKKGEAQETATDETATPPDPLGRETPRGTIMGFLDAAAQENWESAAGYLDLSFLSKAQAKQRGPYYARSLQTLLDQGGWIMPSTMISDDPKGKPNDTLEPKETDRIGTLKAGDQAVDVLAQRENSADGGGIWLIAADTLKPLPEMVEEISPPLINKVLPAALAEKKVWGVPLGHWGAMVALAVLAYMASMLLVLGLQWSTQHLCKRFGYDNSSIFAALRLPLSMYMGVWVFVYGAIALGISALARQHFSLATVIVGWLSLILFVWRLIDIIADRSQQHMSRLNKIGMMSVIHFLRRSAKFVFIALAGIVILGTFGVDVRTGLAALGIGGIALALGAQKTIENFVGTIMLVIDQPVRLGDYCKIGATEGTVEDIGMRSTRLRTGARTIVTIPNGDFSSQRIENFARRDRYLFNHIIGLRYETTPDQLRWLLVELRALLYAHPRVSPDPARVRLKALNTSSIDIEFFAYVTTATFDDFLEVQEDLILRIMETVEAGGAGFAFPSQTVYNAEDIKAPQDRVRAAEEQVRRWRAHGELPLPKFGPEQIERLKDTIDFPPHGSVGKTPE